ncbi:MAG: CHAT domain-containing protein [Planctomycetota bacterium]|nr:MAG: CHAT domain-containing protein [Planctomycetota bacterium]
MSPLPPCVTQICGLAVSAGLLASLMLSASSAQIVLPPGLGAPGGGQTVPTAGYDLALLTLASGDFTAALQIASEEYQGSVKAGAQRWIDSIAAAAAVGECHYELGDFRRAVAAYDEALLLSAVHADWLLAVQFPPQPLRPLAQPRVAKWGQSRRNTTPASIPDTMSIRRGGGDPQQVLQKGGILSAPVLYPVRPQEIMRSLVIAIYRRTEILGELSRDGASLDEATKALSRRPAPPNHYSQSWIDIALGTAYWAQGKSDQALPLLNRGLLVGNQFDHPLTSWGLIVLGRIALDSDQPAAAAKLFEEATYTAADYGDARALEEAFRLAFTSHVVAGSRGIPPSISAGTEWARVNLPALRASLLAMQAESLAIVGNARGAAKILDEIDGRFLRGDMGRGSLGAQAAYAAALAAFKTGDIVAGDKDLARALTIARPRTPRLFQTVRLVELVLAGSSAISDRQADALFARLLGDPSPRDFAADPIGTLARITAHRSDAFDAWMIAASRRGNDATLNAAESLIRSRWLSSEPLGGRRTGIETLLQADPNTQPRAAAARRAEILAKHPELAVVLDKLTRVRTSLTAALLARAAQDAGAALPGEPVQWREYGQLAERLSQLVADISASRDPSQIDFPPLTAAVEIRRRLVPKQLILSFHWTASGLWAALESHDRAAIWQVRQSAVLAKEIATLVKSIGIFDPVTPVSADRLMETEWRAVAARIEHLLFENSKVVLGDGVDELIIVPDGLLWYLPFELLPVGSGRGAADAQALLDDRVLLRDACQIRYCPTRSLVVSRFEKSRDSGLVGVYAGKMFRGDRPEIAQETTARIRASLPHAMPLTPLAGGVATPLVASLYDTLVIFEELAFDEPNRSRPLVLPLNGKGGVTFGDWLAPPYKRPQRVVLPGWQTAMAGGLAKLPARPGDDIFFAATDLLAAGAQTALLSRWRVGGKVGIDLMDEFLRDLCAPVGALKPANGSPVAPESWHRAVDIVTAETPDLTREPRIKQTPKAEIIDARHPFFWAGYLLIDCGTGTYSDEPLPAAAAQPVPRPAAVGPAPILQPAAPAAPKQTAPAAAQPAPKKPAIPPAAP